MEIKKCKCPICGKEISFSKVDMNHFGAVCTHKTFDVKIYIEERLI